MSAERRRSGPAGRARVVDLPPTERALLWCLRAAVVGRCTGWPVAERIEAVLDGLGASDIAPDLDRAVRVLDLGARRTLAVDCVCMPEVSADEALLLRVIGLSASERHDGALDLLLELLDEPHAVAAAAAFRRLALGLALASPSLCEERILH